MLYLSATLLLLATSCLALPITPEQLRKRLVKVLSAENGKLTIFTDIVWHETDIDNGIIFNLCK